MGGESGNGLLEKLDKEWIDFVRSHGGIRALLRVMHGTDPCYMVFIQNNFGYELCRLISQTHDAIQQAHPETNLLLQQPGEGNYAIIRENLRDKFATGRAKILYERNGSDTTIIR